MKNLMRTFVAISILLLIGCNETPPTEPIPVLEKFCNPIKEVINICCSVQDPMAGACQVMGEVTYTHEIIDLQSTQNGLSLVHVQIEMEAELCDMFGMIHPPWGIVGSSVDFVYVSEEGVYLLQKAYPICNRNQCVLIVQYLVTTEGVGIPNMWVMQIDKDT
ncbi:MAG: hypothetical protein KJN64_14660 [Ignavibacteria bacterium]|nr:hypothetical protein [Ignavibacteria bacterium]